jgi:LPXTG-motif cell wall-anchored protein
MKNFYRRFELNFDLGDIDSLINSIGSNFNSAFKTVNAPTSVPIAGAQVPGRPGYVYGPGGSIQAVNPATGGLLPPINSGVFGTNSNTFLLLAGVGVLALAFFMAVRK